MDSEISLNWINERINDKKHFTARWLDAASQSTGQPADNIAKISAIILFLILALADHQAHIVANSILVLVPFLLIFVYPNEKPTDSSLQVYFTVFGALTVLDRNLEKIPLYYVIKLVILLLLYLPPINLAEVIEDQIKKLVGDEKKNDDDKSKQVSKKSSRASNREDVKPKESSKREPLPPPAAPKESSKRESLPPQPPKESSKREQLPPPPAPAPEPAAAPPQEPAPAPAPEPAPAPPQEPAPAAAPPKEPAAAPAPAPEAPPPPAQQEGQQQSPAPQDNAQVPTPAPENGPESQRLGMDSKSGTDLAGGSRRLKIGDNPMASGSFHNLKSEPDGFNSRLIGPGNNLHDLIFLPMNALVFNAPFDFENLTYHMKIRNNSHHRIAFAVKGNAVPRVMVFPPMGIFELKETKIIAVTVQKFEYNFTDFDKDRIAIDYVILPDNNKEKNFSMKMFQNSDSKRRKNIKIMYNP